MKNIIIITGHANYATGLLSSIEMIAGENEDIIAVDFNDGVDIESVYDELVSKHIGDNILFVCDLLGGTPFKEASKIACEKNNIELVIGCNLGAMLEISLIKDTLSLNDLVAKIIDSSKKNISHLDKKIVLEQTRRNNETL
jgi:PTS system N-acetylgalactosamine-specific IIA component